MMMKEKLMKSIQVFIVLIQDFLIDNIDSLDTKNAQGEFYLTDLIGIANNQKQDIVIVQVDEDSIKGINSMSQLNEVEDIMQKKLIEDFMEQGVYFQDPTSTYIDSEVTISSGDKNISQHSFNW